MKTNSNLLLTASQVTYGSANDERAFFEWLERIDGVENVKGSGEDLHIRIKEDIDEYGLIDLIALFFRYDVDLTQIPRVVAAHQHPWLLNESAFWFSAMFPESK